MAMRQHDAIRPQDRVDGRCSGKKEWTDEFYSSVHSFLPEHRPSTLSCGRMASC